MPRISQQSIDSVLTGSDIVSVVQSYGIALENRGTRWFGVCPFHSERTPSFSVTQEQNLFYCFGCHAGGNVITFVREMEKCSFFEAVEFLSKKSGIPLQYESFDSSDFQEDEQAKRKKAYIELYTRMAGTFHYMLLKTDGGKIALDYLRSRGISDKTIEKFNLGYAPSDRFWLRQFLGKKNFSQSFLDGSGLFTQKNPAASFFFDRLMFPICSRNGETVAFGGRRLERTDYSAMPHPPPKYMNSSDLLQYKKGETLFALNYAKDAIRKEKRVIFCEGYMDAIAYHQCEICFAVAPLGTALTESQLKLVKNSVSEVLLSFDSDAAGKDATKKAILLCRSHSIPVRVIRLSGGKDPAEIMLSFGKNALLEAISSAILDFDWLTETLFLENNGKTSESTAKIESEFFVFLDALKSEVEKEHVISKIAQRLGSSADAVLADYKNRQQLSARLNSYAVLHGISESSEAEKAGIALDSEIRALFSVISNLSLFPLMKEALSADDFENPIAKMLFGVLESCQKEGTLSLSGVQAKIGNDELWRSFTESIVRGEYSENAEQLVKDSIALLKKHSLEKRRAVLQARIQQLQTESHSGEDLLVLIEEKMGIDQILDKK